ncbi:MAG: alpha-E domain-containing protein [Parvularculaceae bacterium]|nr:alpha-E domain-containing protein [Parvularculaceae bacterium]
MLSRVAENLFWLGRYIERAENVARLIDAARRMASLPQSINHPGSNEWSSILIAAGARETFGPDYPAATAEQAAEHLLFSKDNPSSAWRCLEAARENARTIRFILTRECWEVLNAAWSQMRFMNSADATGAALCDTIDWVKARSAEFRGTVYGTMIRDDAFHFIRLGTAVERLDYTARLIDVKYHVLLPSVDEVGSGADQNQWISLLQAVAGHRAYIHTTRDDVTARGVADFLILNETFPRSICYNARLIGDHVRALGDFYEAESPCADHIEGFVKGIADKSIDDIFDAGLHEFLTSIIASNYSVADSLAAAYGFAEFVSDPETDLGSPEAQ